MRYEFLQERGALNESDDASGQTPLAAGRGATWRGRPIAPAVLALLPEAVVREYRVVPLSADGETLTVASSTPGDIALADRISLLSARKCKMAPASEEEIAAFINRHYGGAPTRAASAGPPASPPPARTVASRRKGVLAAAEPDFDVPAGGWMMRAADPDEDRQPGLDPTVPIGGSGVLTYVVEEGQRVLLRRPNGTMDILVGPTRVWRGRNQFRRMKHHVAHPGDYLIVRYRDGRQEHLPGPSEVWFDPREHEEVTREEALQVAAKEAVVVYSSKEGTAAVQRRVEYGPTLFIPRPGEWLHTFAWHASQGGSHGTQKLPKGLVFQKLWLMPDQMYHDVPGVRTADDAVLTIRLMIFFELLDISRMLETTHDPIGDFVNAATSDVVDFSGRHDFEAFKRNTDKLNQLETYRQLAERAGQCGYRINKVVYRGYGAPDRLQQMHDQAIEARTRLQLERATEQQAQDLENFKLESQMLRAGKRRHEQTAEVGHELELARTRQEAALRDREASSAFARQQRLLEAELRQRVRVQRDVQRREHLSSLRAMGVDLTALLTQGRADRVIELRGQGAAAHLHLEGKPDGDGASSPR